MGVYDRKHLNKLLTSPAFSKEESIRGEIKWTSEYLKVAGRCDHALGKDWGVKGYETSNGRVSKIIETQFLRKYKGDWGQIRHDGSTLDGLALTGMSRLDRIAELSLSSHYEILLKEHKRIQIEVEELSISNLSLASNYESLIKDYDRVQSKVEKLSLETTELRKSLAALYETLSWRLTAPLRFFRALLMRLIGVIK
jgi:hypothetical protein